MKKILLFAITAATLATSAFAGDLPAQLAPPYLTPAAVGPPAYSWTGCYIGIEGGGSWGRAATTAVASPNPATVGLPITNGNNLSGGLAGGTAGCNYQIGNWVFGIEGDTSWTNTSGTANDIPPFTPSVTNQLQEKWTDTVRGRIGYAWDHVLFYGTGGGAFAATDYKVCSISDGCVSDSKTRIGWVAGAGIEYAFWDRLSLKLEYLHADFGNKNYIDPSIVVGTSTFVTRNIRLTDDVVRVGLNYQFGSDSQVAPRY